MVEDKALYDDDWKGRKSKNPLEYEVQMYWGSNGDSDGALSFLLFLFSFLSSLDGMLVMISHLQ